MPGVVLTAACLDLRRRLGPLAWTVLEDLALDAASDEAGEMVARTSARRVAEHLDIQPGSAARALARLRKQGLVSLAREAGPGGRFGLSVYRLSAVPGLTFPDRTAPCIDPPTMAAPHMVAPSMATPNMAAPGWGWVGRNVVQDGADAAGEDAAAPPEMAAAPRPTAEAARTASTVLPPAAPARPGRARRTTPTAPVVGQQATLWDEPT